MERTIVVKKEMDLDEVAKSASLYGAEIVKSLAKKQLESDEAKNGGMKITNETLQFLSLSEFDNANLLAAGFSDAFRALVVDLSIKYQKEFNCNTTATKTLAHIAALDFVKLMELKSYCNRLLDRNDFSEMNTRRLAVLEKSYDKVHTKFLLTIQTLKAFNQPQLQMTVKANVANFAENQMIQEIYETKAK